MLQVAPRLRRWTARHDHWEEDVGSLAVEPSKRPPLRLCPERWLGKGTHDELRKTLRPLLDLPVERVLVSHGALILGGGKRALAAALE